MYNNKEKELLNNWHNNVKDYDNVYSFPEINKNASSYYLKREDTDKPVYLTEYDFETLPQLKEILSEMWTDEEYMQMIIKPVLVAAMKNKPQDSDNCSDESSRKTEVKDGEKLPDFIYNF